MTVINTTDKLFLQKYRKLLVTVKPLLRKGDTSLLHHTMQLCIAKFPDENAENSRQLIRLLDISLIIAGEVGLGTSSIIAFALAYTFTDNEISETGDWLDSRSDIHKLIAGLRVLESLNFDKISIESENFRQMLLSMTTDLRVILIRLSVNLFSMRHYEKVSASEGKQILRKVIYVYIPFCHRLGLYRIKADLEERVMRITEPQAYMAIVRQIDESKPKQEAYFSSFLKPVIKELTRNGFDCEIKWRYKSIPSIYAKMQKQGVGFDGIFDLFAIRIISRKIIEDEKADCWKIYSIVSNIYKPDPSRLRDWISKPKDSGYESLHTTVQTPDTRWVEIQIRTTRMDEIAERGDAAHWKYKEKRESGASDQWIRQIRTLLEQKSDSDESHFSGLPTHPDSESIYVLTPAGDVKQLPVGATVLDFAFEIHSNVGASCSGARVNNRNVPIRHLLQNGDIVEILTSKSQKPKLDWLNIVLTNRAKNRIRRALNDEKLRDAENGREILGRKLKNWKLTLTDELNEKILKHFRMKTMVDFYAALGTEKIEPIDVRDLIQQKEEEPVTPVITKFDRKVGLNTLTAISGANEQLVFEGAGKHMSYALAKCCTPIHGDDVFGFVTITKGITIHRSNCPNARDMKERFPHRVIKVHWSGTEEAQPYQTVVRITGEDRMGLLNEITQLITNDLKINMLGVSIESKGGQFDGRIRVHVFNSLQLFELLHKLERIRGVTRARRLVEG